MPGLSELTKSRSGTSEYSIIKQDWNKAGTKAYLLVWKYQIWMLGSRFDACVSPSINASVENLYIKPTYTRMFESSRECWISPLASNPTLSYAYIYQWIINIILYPLLNIDLHRTTQNKKQYILSAFIMTITKSNINKNAASICIKLLLSLLSLLRGPYQKLKIFHYTKFAAYLQREHHFFIER